MMTSTSRTALLACLLAATSWPNITAQDHDHDAAAPHQEAAHVHPEAAKLANPVQSTAASIAAGRTLFEKNCVSCHGATGAGDGKSAAQMNPKPSNLLDATWKHGSSDGEIYTLIRDGSKNTSMKGFAGKMSAQELWSVVNYVKSLSTTK
jgi:mono/diheme cytochrome c family protein